MCCWMYPSYFSRATEKGSLSPNESHPRLMKPLQRASFEMKSDKAERQPLGAASSRTIKYTYGSTLNHCDDILASCTVPHKVGSLF